VPERVDHVRIAMNRGRPFKLPRAGRDELLEHLRKNETAAGIVLAFEAVGANRAVDLTDADRAVLFSVLENWSLTRGFDQMPDKLRDLRARLSDDLADAEQRADHP
jgi:hypothetical protein